MISEEELSRQCNPRTLQRARSIAASDRNILTKQVRYDDDEAILSAFVASSHGWNDRYRTSVTIDEENDFVADYVCTCPAYHEYDGMCKHCTALVLAYNDDPQKFLGYRSHRVAATSGTLADLMNRTRQADTSEARGAIDIETTIVYGYRTWSAHFKVTGPQGSYVMKSVSDFVDRMRTGEHFSYGKKLAFTHMPAMLTERGRGIAQFLERAISLREQANGAAFWRYRNRDDVGRNLDLSEFELIELLDLLAGTTFTVEGADYGTRSVTHAHIVNEDPSLEVSLYRTEGGYTIRLSQDAPFVAHGDRMYLWLEDVFYRCSTKFASTAGFLRTAADNDGGSLFVSDADMPLLFATVIPVIEGNLHVSAPPETEVYRPLPCELEFYFDKTDRAITCTAQATYGELTYRLFESEPSKNPSPKDEENTPGPLRDEGLEAKARALVERYFDTYLNAGPSLDLNDDEGVSALVFGGLMDFQTLGTAFTTPAFDRLLTDTKPHISMGLSLVGNLINLTVSSEDLPANELAALLASYRKHKHYHRLKSGAFLNLEGYDLAQLDHLVEDFGITGKQLATGTVELPSYRAFYLDEQLEDARRDRSFTRYVENFRHADEASYEPPAHLTGTLRPYQEAGFRWLSARCDAGFGGILADEMGLGKSVQLIALLLARRAEARSVGPSLIVCPASLVYNWLAEFERFAPELDVRPVVGMKRERAHERQRAFTPAEACDVLITSYDLLRIDADEWASRTFYCCALDEAQYIKNHATKTARGVKRLQANHRFALTGTPMENRLSELWSIFDFLMPGLLGSYMRFRERFEIPVLGGDEDAAQRLQTLVGPFMLRRLKADVLSDLPDKLESVVYTPMTDEQQRLYAASEQQLRDALTEQKNNRHNKDYDKRKVEILAELTKLRQLCCDPRLLYENYAGGAAKLDAIMELVESAMDAGEKTLVFSQFTSFLTLIAEQLDKREIRYYSITGATPKRQRLNLVDAFNEDDTPVFLVSLKAGGTGLNLTGASVVVHADPWWNAAAQNQATDRAHRIGQTKVVNVCKVIAKDTIEERILHLQEAKSDLANQVIGAGGISLAALSREDLIDLLQG